MIAFKCKMCGGELNIIEGSNICECEFCGTQQTIPSADNDKKINLFNRANRLRMNAEFDKAATVYASITAEFPEEAEAYWGLCLCKYGIEYVDDPLTGNKIPTCHRTLPESIMDDSDFDQACENADPESKKLYREEAKAIDRLQQDILNIVASEEPFDVFICYKETDENGERTDDSVISQEIYDFLTEKGLKVFFARITLEDKLGQQYEPYIYAALHSAKVMLAVGTQFDYFDAVWVKNEWARYLDMMKTDKSKTLIPCYKGIDAYDMPREFKNLQALDMGKIGWKQDLLRGIRKLTATEEKLPQQSMQQYMVAGANIDNLMKRARLFMEDGEFDNANEYLDKVLDENAEYAPAYIAKVCIALGMRREEDLGSSQKVFTDNSNWKKAIRFASPDQKAVYQGYLASVLQRIVKGNMGEYETSDQCKAARSLLAPYAGYEGISDIISELDQRIEYKTQYEQRMSDALGEIRKLKDQYEENLRNCRKTINELKANKDKKQEELNQCLVESSSVILSLLKEESAVKGMFAGKKKEELTSKRTLEEEKRKSYERQMADEDRKCIQAISDVENRMPKKEELEYKIARIYYDFGLYEEATITFFKVVSYNDAREIINNDVEIIAAKKNILKKAIQQAVGSQKSIFAKAVDKELSKEENGYCCEQVDEFLAEIIIKSFAMLTNEEKINTVIEVRTKEFDVKEMGYSKKETKKLLNELLSCCYGSDPSEIEHQFVAEIKRLNSMVEIWKLWERYELDKKYPDVDKYVRKYKDQERMYGKSRNIDAEIKQIENMLCV